MYYNARCKKHGVVKCLSENITNRSQQFSHPVPCEHQKKILCQTTLQNQDIIFCYVTELVTFVCVVTLRKKESVFVRHIEESQRTFSVCNTDYYSLTSTFLCSHFCV